ncbi:MULTISPECIES: hypothetical protein [Galbibacter]|uniref:hypothetical protein n=1 Tax=Galbibacter orientalis TaxID=453852 RepID=UPI0030032A9D
MNTTSLKSNNKNTKKNSNNLNPDVFQVPVKYYGNVLDNYKCATNYDYLVINCSGTPSFKGFEDNVKFEKADYGTRTHKDLYTVIIDDVKFSTLMFNPRSPKMLKDNVQIKLENFLLYSYTLKELKNLLDTLIAVLGLKVNNVSRLDVCADFENSNEVFENVVRGVATSTLLISGRPKKVTNHGNFNEPCNFHGTTRKGKLTYNGLSIGKKSSTRFLRIYNKSLEMEQVKYKHHIVDWWKNNGIKNENVWRFEYSLNSAFMKQYDIKYDDIWDENFVVKLLETAYNNHFELKYNTGKTEINKEKAFPLFSFLSLKKNVKRLVKRVKELDETIQRSITSVKRQIKGLFRSYYSTGCDAFYDAIFIHLNHYDLTKWFEFKEDEYLKEFEKQSIVIQ